MTRNPILDELHDIRTNILVEHGNDLANYLHSEFKRLEAEGHPVVQTSQRSIRRDPGDVANKQDLKMKAG